jgi:hypothetical protein
VDLIIFHIFSSFASFFAVAVQVFFFFFEFSRASTFVLDSVQDRVDSMIQEAVHGSFKQTDMTEPIISPF